MSVTVEGQEKIAAALKRIEQDLGRELVVGVLGAKAKAEHDGEIGTNPKVRPKVVDVATWHEFGIPGRLDSRSFLRATLKLKRDAVLSQAARELRPVLTGKKPPDAAWNRLGLYVVGLVQQRIADGIPPELKRRVGTPLIDTGQLRSSITHEVRR